MMNRRWSPSLLPRTKQVSSGRSPHQAGTRRRGPLLSRCLAYPLTRPRNAKTNANAPSKHPQMSYGPLFCKRQSEPSAGRLRHHVDCSGWRHSSNSASTSNVWPKVQILRVRRLKLASLYAVNSANHDLPRYVCHTDIQQRSFPRDVRRSMDAHIGTCKPHEPASFRK